MNDDMLCIEKKVTYMRYRQNDIYEGPILTGVRTIYNCLSPLNMFFIG